MLAGFFLFVFFVAACEHPLDRVIGDTSYVEVIGYNKPVLEGASITFHCPPGMELIGYGSATCMGNGEWEPDPQNITCNESKYSQSMIIL